MLLEKNSKESNEYQKVIIQYDHKLSFIYPLKTYNKNPLLKKYISKEKFIKILDNANIIIYDAKIRKDKFDTVEINKITYGIFIFVVFLTLLSIIFFYFIPRIPKKQKILKFCGIIFLLLSIIILLFMEIFFSFREKYGKKTLYEFYANDMKRFINDINEIWKDKFIFCFDEQSKNIIIYIKNESNIIKNNEEKNSIQSSSNSNSNSNSNNIINNNDLSEQIGKTNSTTNLYSDITSK
jgi:hypothetical protein